MIGFKNLIFERLVCKSNFKFNFKLLVEKTYYKNDTLLINILSDIFLKKKKNITPFKCNNLSNTQND